MRAKRIPTVAQSCTLPYRRIAFGKPSRLSVRGELAIPGGLQIRDTAKCNSALQHQTALPAAPHGSQRVEGRPLSELAGREQNAFDKRLKIVFLVLQNMKTTMSTKQGLLPDYSRMVGIWQHRCALSLGSVGREF